MENTKYQFSQINKDKSNGFIVFTNLNIASLVKDTQDNIKYITNSDNVNSEIFIKNIKDFETKNLFIRFVLKLNNTENTNTNILSLDNTNLLIYNKVNNFTFLGKEIILEDKFINKNYYNITIQLYKNKNILNTSINGIININDETLNSNMNIKFINSIFQLQINNKFNIGDLNVNVTSNTNNQFFNIFKKEYPLLFNLTSTSPSTIPPTTTTPLIIEEEIPNIEEDIPDIPLNEPITTTTTEPITTTTTEPITTTTTTTTTKGVVKIIEKVHFSDIKKNESKYNKFKIIDLLKNLN